MKHLLPVLALLVACGGGGSTKVKGDKQTTSTFTLDGIDAVVQTNPSNPMSLLVTLTAQSDANVSIEVDDGSWLRDTPTWQLQAGVAREVVVLGLHPKTDHTLALKGDASGGLGTWAIDAFPRPFPGMNIDDRTGGTLDPAEVVCSQAGQEGNGGEQFYNFCMDSNGIPRWILEHPSGQPFLAVNPMPGGGWVGTSDWDPLISIWDSASRHQSDWTPDDFAGKTRFEHDGFDMHDVIAIHSGPWAGYVAALTIVWDETAQREHIGQGILVFDPANGDVIWDWSTVGQSGDGVSIDENKLPLNRFGVLEHEDDWLHANALVHAPDGKFWMSLRHQDWLIVIDPDTDAIDHRIGWGGDFELVADLDAGGAGDPMNWFYHQHAPEIVEVDGDRIRFLVYDNGNRRRTTQGQVVDPEYNRAAEFIIDTTTMRAVNTFAYGGPTGDENQFYSSGVGDADMVHTGDRIALMNGWNQPFMAQVSYPEGQLLWKARVFDVGEMYRVGVRPSLYDTSWGN